MSILRVLPVFLFLASIVPAEEVKVTLLATTDLHGNLAPYDYYAGQPVNRGLAKIATLIQIARRENPNSLLIDCGDTIQGTPLESVYQQYVQKLDLSPTALPRPRPEGDPMMLAMNAIGYDVMVVGNHEFNFGMKNLAAARWLARFPWIAANIRSNPAVPAEPFAPYFVKTVGGVKIGIIGITTPFVPQWETEAHYDGYTFLPAVVSVRYALAELKAIEHPDIVIVAAHSGLDRDLEGDMHVSSDPFENSVYQIATEVPGIDGIVFGHTHSQLAGRALNGVQLLQPKNWGMALGRMDFTLERADAGWKVVSKASELIPVTAETQADAKIIAIGRPYHEAAERFLNTPVAEAPAALDARMARVEDTALIDAVQTVELFYSKADVSFASSFNPRATIPKGRVTVRQIAAVYVYENTLYAIEGTGKMVREALENSARYFKTCSGDCTHGPLVNPEVIGFNFDMAQGVEYEIDLTRPVGDRIRNLRWHGKPLADSQPLRIAVNNYRAGGSAGYDMFRGAKVVWRSSDEIRDLIVSYYTGHKQLPAKPDDNWRVVPKAARKTLQEEAQAEAQKPAFK